VAVGNETNGMIGGFTICPPDGGVGVFVETGGIGVIVAVGVLEGVTPGAKV